MLVRRDVVKKTKTINPPNYLQIRRNKRNNHNEPYDIIDNRMKSCIYTRRQYFEGFQIIFIFSYMCCHDCYCYISDV